MILEVTNDDMVAEEEKNFARLEAMVSGLVVMVVVAVMEKSQKAEVEMEKSPKVEVEMEKSRKAETETEMMEEVKMTEVEMTEEVMMVVEKMVAGMTAVEMNYQQLVVMVVVRMDYLPRLVTEVAMNQTVEMLLENWLQPLIKIYLQK